MAFASFGASRGRSIETFAGRTAQPGFNSASGGGTLSTPTGAMSARFSDTASAKAVANFALRSRSVPRAKIEPVLEVTVTDDATSEQR